jgi:hypothetical protein
MFTVSSAGGYRVKYSIKLRDPLLASARVMVNGSPSNALVDSPSQSTSRLDGESILILTPGTTLSIQLYGLLGAAILQQGAGASLIVEKLSN